MRQRKKDGTFKSLLTLEQKAQIRADVAAGKDVNLLIAKYILEFGLTASGAYWVIEQAAKELVDNPAK